MLGKSLKSPWILFLKKCGNLAFVHYPSFAYYISSCMLLIWNKFFRLCTVIFHRCISVLSYSLYHFHPPPPPPPQKKKKKKKATNKKLLNLHVIDCCSSVKSFGYSMCLGTHFTNGLGVHDSNLAKIRTALTEKNKDQIMSQICTCHDTPDVMACANLRHDWTIPIKMRAKRIITRFQLWSHT